MHETPGPVPDPRRCLIDNVTSLLRIVIAYVWPMWIHTLLCFLRPIKIT